MPFFVKKWLNMASGLPKTPQEGFRWIIGAVIIIFIGVIGYSVYSSKPNKDEPIAVADMFSPDVSSTMLERAIKKTMDDPDSYQHVETTHTVDADRIYVKTTFRGKNKLGALVLTKAEGVLDKSDGHVITWNITN